MRKIGVFDSGVGGLSVVHAIEKSLDDVEVVFVSDPEHMPYGIKKYDELLMLVRPKIDELLRHDIELIVIACNTVTTTILDVIRAEYPKVTFIGMEPMVKPAALLSKSGKIAVCATPSTLKSNRYAYLKKEFAPNIEVIEPDCSRWAQMIESDHIDRQQIHNIVQDVCDKGADVIVLGCTHYHWIEQIIIEEADGRAQVLQPEPAIINRIRQLLEL